MEEILILFRDLSGDFPKAILREILSFVNPVEALRELKELYCSEHDKQINC